MKIMVKTRNDCCEQVNVTCTPVEFLIVGKALRQFVENSNSKSKDRKIALQMLETEPIQHERSNEDADSN